MENLPEETRLKLQHFNKTTKYRFVTHVNTPHIDRSNPVIDFAKQLINHDIEYVRSTFNTGDFVVSVDNYKKENNKVSYEIEGKWVVRFEMHAFEADRLYFVKQQICEKSSNPDVDHRVVRERIWQLHLSREISQLRVTMWAYHVLDEHQEICEFTAIRNEWNRTLGFWPCDCNQKNKRLVRELEELKSEVLHVKVDANKTIAAAQSMIASRGDQMTARGMQEEEGDFSAR